MIRVPSSCRSALAVLVVGLGGLSASASMALDLAHLDVCARLPGEEVARTVGATLDRARPFNDPEGALARCTYFLHVESAVRQEPLVFSVEVLAEEDFVEIRPYVEEPIHEIAGIGDGAWAHRDPDSNDRLRLYALRKGVATLDVTGEDEGEVRKVAALAISKF